MNQTEGFIKILQDEWSILRPTFGEYGQLTVIGISERKAHRMYVLECSICRTDEELFQDAYFYSNKSSLLAGNLPCGCARNHRWSKEQYGVLCSRKAKEIGYTFLDFEGEWLGAKTKIKMLCEKHGEWVTGCITHLIHGGRGCPTCKLNTISNSSKKPDDVMIASFFASGSFHPETKFWRSERKTKPGFKTYWHLYCPECKETGESLAISLQQGSRSCACSKHSQKQAYLNYVLNEKDTPVAVKFGISKDIGRRLKEQNSKTAYIILNHSIYTFPDVPSCKQAELDCKQELECGIVLRRDMPDGWSETTWVYNLEKIIEIYERNGGIRVD